MVAVEVHTSSPALELSLSRAAFSPNRDRSAEWTVVTVSVDEDATLVLDPRRRGQGPLRRLADEPIGAGKTSVRWNGTGDSGRTLADGRYEVRSGVADEVGNVAGTIVPVIVDTKRPTLHWDGARPDPYVGGRVRPRRAHRTELGARRAAVVRDAVDRVAKRFDAVTHADGAFAFEWNGRDERRRPTSRGCTRSRSSSATTPATSPPPGASRSGTTGRSMPS